MLHLRFYNAGLLFNLIYYYPGTYEGAQNG